MAKNPVLFIGLGGMGVNTVRKIYDRHSRLSEKERQHIHYLSIDFETKDFLNSPESNSTRAFRQAIGLKNAEQQIEKWFNANRDDMQAWWPRTKVKGESKIYLPVASPMGGAAAGQIRANGAITFYGNFTEGINLKGKIDSIVDMLHKLSLDDNIDSNKKRIYVITSLGGGTGSGIFPDLISYLRTHESLGSDDRIYGVFYDPTLMTKLLSTSWDSHQGMAALVETDHWMSHFPEYIKSYGNGAYTVQASTNLKKHEKWLHGVYLIQSHTTNDKLFMGDTYEKYTDMVSEYLSLLSTLDDYTEKVETNEVNRMDMLPNYNGRSVKYGSFGIAEIKVPIHDIQQYIVARLLIERDQAKLWPEDDDLNSEVLNFLNSFSGINSESAINLMNLPALFRQQSAYEKYIGNTYSAAQNDLLNGNTRNRGIVNPSVYTNYIKNLESFAKALEKHFSEKLRVAVDEFLKTLQFDEILNWLETMGVLLAVQKDALAKNPPVSTTSDVEGGIIALQGRLEDAMKVQGSTKRYNLLKNERNEYKDAKNMAVAIHEEWHRRNLFHVEVNLASGIYSHFAGTLQQMISKVSAIRDGYTRLLIPYKRKLADTKLRTLAGDSQYSRGSIFSAERLRRNEYSLALLVDIPDEYINERLQDIRRTHSAEQILGPILKSGTRGNLPALDSNIADPEELKQYFEEIVNEHLVPAIANRVHEDFNIEIALDAYLGHFHNIVLENTSGLAREKIRERISLEFGDKYVSSLMDVSTVESTKKWRELALQALFERMGAIVSPFWRVSEVERGAWRDDWKKNEGVAVPQKIDKPIHFLIMPKFNNLPNIELGGYAKFMGPEKMNDRIAFLVMDVGAPLHCVMQTTSLNQIFNSYLDHITSSNLPPAHIDQRFINRGTDITQAPKGDDLGIVLYILGLSFKIIKRDGKNYFIEQNKPIRIAKSYESLRTFLVEGDAKILAFIGEQIALRLGAAWYGNKMDLKVLAKFFIEGCEAHLRINKPVGLTDAQWREKVTTDIGLEYEIESDGGMHIVKNGIIPTNTEAVEGLINRLSR